VFAEEYGGLGFVFGPVQRGVAIDVFCVHCRFFGEQRGDDLEMALVGGAVQGGPSVFIAGIGIRTPGEEQHSDLRVAVVRRPIQRGSSEVILSVDIRTAGQVLLDGLDVAVRGIIAERAEFDGGFAAVSAEEVGEFGMFVTDGPI